VIGVTTCGASQGLPEVYLHFCGKDADVLYLLSTGKLKKTIALLLTAAANAMALKQPWCGRSVTGDGPV